MTASTDSYVPVSVGNRIIGAIIDTFVVLIPLIIVYIFMHLINDKLANALSGVVVWAVYEMLMYTKSGKTIGKGVVNARVTSDPATLALPTTQQALVRSMARNGAPLAVIAGFVPIVSYLSIIWAFVVIVTTLVDPLKRGIHDKIAGTYIVSTAHGAVLGQQTYEPPSDASQGPPTFQ